LGIRTARREYKPLSSFNNSQRRSITLRVKITSVCTQPERLKGGRKGEELGSQNALANICWNPSCAAWNTRPTNHDQQRQFKEWGELLFVTCPRPEPFSTAFCSRPSHDITVGVIVSSQCRESAKGKQKSPKASGPATAFPRCFQTGDDRLNVDMSQISNDNGIPDLILLRTVISRFDEFQAWLVGVNEQEDRRCLSVRASVFVHNSEGQ
jgi:hypothetical protein